VIKMLDFVVEERRVAIVWELVQGADLLDLLNEHGGRLEERLAAFYFAQLARGVEEIHAHGLAHRDIKPENCMVERATGTLKIIDFGLSKHQQSAVTLGVGTPDYLAPELLGEAGAAALRERVTGAYDARATDVWAMGVLLYLLATGQYPFEDPSQPQNVVATLGNIARGRARPLPRGLSAELADLLGGLLAVDPRERLTLAGLAAHPWLRLAAEERERRGLAPASPAAPRSPAGVVASGAALGGSPSPGGSPTSAGLPARSPSFSFPRAHFAAKATPAPVGAAFRAPDALAPPSSPPAPRRGGSAGGRDAVVPVAPARPGAPEAKRASGVGGFCRAWFGHAP
jgi:serine/threonine protein kinase